MCDCKQESHAVNNNVELKFLSANPLCGTHPHPLFIVFYESQKLMLNFSPKTSLSYSGYIPPPPPCRSTSPQQIAR